MSDRLDPNTALLMQDPVLALAGVKSYKVLAGIVLLERVGQGSSGVVYRGWHLSYSIEVAVKILLPALASDVDYLDRFQREVRAAMQINHANIARVYDYGSEHGLNYVVMEFVRGGSLRSLIAERGAMQVPEALSCIVDAASGLADVHSCGMAHLRISPDCVMFSDAGRTKIVDLASGVRMGRIESSKFFGVGGALRYLAPEQWKEGVVGPAADVWALGAILYLGLTGRDAVGGSSPLEVARIAQESDLPPIGGIPGVPNDLSAIYERCVARDPGLRFQDAGELLRSLERFGAQATAVSMTQRRERDIATEAAATIPLRSVGESDIDGKGGSSGSIAPGALDVVAFDAERFRRKLSEELQGLPQDFEGLRAALRTAHEVSRSTIAAAFEEALNRQAQSMPHATYEEKKVVANWINEEARNLGLAIRCPKTGAPALLRAQPGGPNGRFAVEVTDARGKRHHTSTTAQLPALALLPDELARAPWGARLGRGK